MKKTIFYLIIVILISSCRGAIKDVSATKTPNYFMGDLDNSLLQYFNNAASGDTLFIPSGNYTLNKTQLKGVLEKDISIVGQGEVHIYCKEPFIETKKQIVAEFQFRKTLKRGQQKFNFSNTKIKKGDVLLVSSQTKAELSWGYKKIDCIEIQSVQRDYFTTKDGLNFNYYQGEDLTIRVLRPHVVHLENLGFSIDPNMKKNKVISLIGNTLKLNNINGDSYRKTDNFIQLYGCINSDIQNINVESFQYGIVINYCRDINVSSLEANNTLHGVVPGTWTTNLKVDGYTGENTAIDAHPSFNVWYNNVDINTGMSYFNCRALGVKLTNCKIRASENNKSKKVYIGVGNLSDENKDLYYQYDILIDNVDWLHTSNGTNGFRVNKCRNLTITNSTTHLIATINFQKSIIIDNCKIGAFACYDSNFDIKNTKFLARLQGNNETRSPISCSYSGEANLKDCSFKGYDKNYLFNYIHSAKTSVVFDNCEFGNFKGIAKKMGESSKQYNKVDFQNCSFNDTSFLRSDRFNSSSVRSYR